MVCIGSSWGSQNCTTSPKKNLKFGMITYGQIAVPGSSFNIHIPIIDTSLIYGDCVTVDIYDKDTGQFIYQSNILDIAAGTEGSIDINLVMPNTSIWNLHLSLVYQGALFPECEDIRNISILKDDPTLPHYNICDSNNVCRRILGNGTNQCTNIGSTCYSNQECKADEMNIMGICAPKSFVAIGAVVLALVLLK